MNHASVDANDLRKSTSGFGVGCSKQQDVRSERAVCKRNETESTIEGISGGGVGPEPEFAKVTPGFVDQPFDECSADSPAAMIASDVNVTNSSDDGIVRVGIDVESTHRNYFVIFLDDQENLARGIESIATGSPIVDEPAQKTKAFAFRFVQKCVN